MRSQYIAEESPCLFPRYQAQFWCLYFKEDEKMLEKIQIFCMSSTSLEMGGLESWTYSTSEKKWEDIGNREQQWVFSLLLTKAKLNPVTGSFRLDVSNLEIRCNFLAVKVIKLCSSLWREVVLPPLLDLVLKKAVFLQYGFTSASVRTSDGQSRLREGRRVTSG